MSSSRQYIGKLIIKISNGESRSVTVHKNGRSIILNDGIGMTGDMIVHPMNQQNIEGWVREYGTLRNVFIDSYELISPAMESVINKGN